MARRRATITDLLNDLTFKTIYERYKLIALNAFKWDGLPDGIQERHIERALFDHGQALFFREPDAGYMCLEAQNSGEVNVYGDPLIYFAHGFGYHKAFHVDECVLIENNKLRINTHDILMHYANKLYEAERTMDVNVKACKTPVIITGDDKDILSFKQMFNKVDGNVPAIYADRALNVNSIQALDTHASFLGNELMDYKRSVENELLTVLGINNSPVDRKERVTTVESDSNNQLISSYADMQMEARERAVEAINAKYGLNITVTRRHVDKAVEEVENDAV